MTPTITSRIKMTFSILIFFITSISFGQYTIDAADTTPFEDISTTGTLLITTSVPGEGFEVTDDGEANVTLPFSFNFEGTSSMNLRVGNNGAVLFDNTTDDINVSNITLPSVSSFPTGGFMPFWDDIDSDTGGVYSEIRGTAPNRRCIIQWENRPHYEGQSYPGTATFQMLLFETSNDILFVYEDVVFDIVNWDYGASATVGIQNPAGTAYQYSYNTASLANGQAIRFSTSPVAGSLTVTTLNDDVAVDGFISLREAIQAANTNTAVNEAPAGVAGEDTIDFDPSLAGGSIVLTNGNLQIEESLIIDGLGADKLSIDGNGGGIFSFNGANTAKHFDVNDLTLTNAVNTLNMAGSGDDILNVNRVTVRNNYDPNSSGSAMVASFAQVNISESAFVNNDHDNTLDLSSASASISNSTFSDNTGKAISIYPGSGLTTNISLTNLTIASNNVGVNVRSVPSTTTLNINYQNSILADNSAGNFVAGTVSGTLAITSGGSNILDDTPSHPAGAYDQRNTDPLLDNLELNNGTYVRPLLNGSPAIDATPAGSSPATDQRGFPRLDGNNNGVTTADSGAFEYSPGLFQLSAFDEVTLLYDSGSDEVRIVETGNTSNILFSMDKDDIDSEIFIDGDNDNNSLTVDASFLDLGLSVNYDGGSQTGAPGDALTIEGGIYTDAIYNFTTSGANGFDGNIDLDGSLITFTGLEPITNAGTAANIIFNLPNVANPDAVLQNNAGAGQSMLAGSTFETTIFTNPTASLTINGGTGIDNISIQGVDAAFDADLTVNGAINDVIEFNTNATDTGSGNLDLYAGITNLGNDITTTGNINFNGPAVVATNIVLTGTDVIFKDTLDGTFNLDISSSGKTHFQAAVGGITPVRRIRTDVGGTTQIDADITTSILQRYREVVGINGNIVLTSVDVAFQDRIVGGDPTAPTDGVGDLTITATGETRFLDQIGKNGTIDERLASLTTNGGGTTSMEAVGPATSANPNIAATGNVQFDDNVVLVAGASAINIGENIILNGTLEGNTDGGEQIIFNGVEVSINNTVGATNRLFAFQIDNAALGKAFINTDIVHTSGIQIYYTPVEINPPSTFLQMDSDNSYISFLSTVRSTIDGFSDLILTANDITFTGAVGDNSQRLLSLTIDTQNEDAVAHIVNDVTFLSTVDLAGNFEQDAGTGTTILNGGNVSGNLDLNTDIITLNAGTMNVTGNADFTVTDNLNTEAGLSAATDVSATTVTINGTLAPGASPGQMVVVGAFNIGAGDTLDEEVNDFTTGGTDYDQVVVTGTVDITGSTLNLIDNTASVGSIGDLLVIIDNDAADPIVGTFAGIAEGDDVAFNGETWRLFYSGGDGNDVVLALVPTPLTDVYVNDDFTQSNGTFILDADPNTALDQNGIVGINAFNTIQEGVDAVDAAGNVNITDDLTTDGAGTYLETVNITKSIHIIGTEGDPTAVFADGNNIMRVFNISNAATDISLEAITVQNGFTTNQGGGIRTFNTGMFSLENCNFLNNSSTGGNGAGGIFIEGATVVVNNSMFDNNTTTATFGGALFKGGGAANLTITNSSFTNNSANGNGGAIATFNSGGIVTITDTTIEDNSTNNVGGGLFMSGGTLNFTGGSLSNNMVTVSGGGFYNQGILTVSSFNNVTINGNTAIGNSGGLRIQGTVIISGGTISGNSTERKGAGIGSANSTLTLDGVTMDGNTVTAAINANDGGGAIYNNGGPLNITNSSQLINNTVVGTGASGGAIYNVSGALTVTNSLIDNNQANRAGGGIELGTSSGLATLTNVNLNNNDALTGPGNGGGMHITGNANAIITGGTVNGNTAAEEGGGLWNGTGSMTIDGTTIDTNTASGAGADQGGGGIFNNGGSLTLLNTVSITNNKADGALGSGGGIFNELGGTLSIDGSLINNNTANRAGGGIELNTNPIDTFTFTNLTLDGNTATGAGAAPGNGGGLHVSGIGTATIISSIIINNNAVEGGGLWNGAGAMTVRNSAIGIDAIGVGGTAAPNEATGDGPDQGGGGIFNDGGTLAVRNGSGIRFNKATGIQGSGGGIHTTGGSVLINNCAVSDNESNRAGGGIEFAGGTLGINNTNIRRNNTGVVTGVGAPGNGGGIHVTGNLNLLLNNLSILDNIAANEGGGLWNGLGTMTIQGTIINNNQANGDDNGASGGGGIYNEGGIVTTNNTTNIQFNTATGGASGSGGGVLNANGSFTATGTTITNNNANRAGGGVEVNGAAAITTLTNVDLNDNRAVSAPGNGGGMHITGASNSSVSGSTITNNGAANEGGGLWNGSGTMTITNTTLEMNDARGDDSGNSGGGAIYNEGGIVTTDAGTVINNNRATIGTTGSGGGVLNANGSFIATGTTITNNNANRAGGGVEVNGAAAITTLTNVNLDDNRAISTPGNGGGMHITGSSNSSISGSTVNNNGALNEGGGLWNGSGTMTITNTTLEMNDARGDDSGNSGGGAIYNEGGIVTTDAGTVINNNRATIGATGSGGGVLNSNGSFIATGTTITNNNANRAGGGVEVNGATAITTLTDVTLDDNNAISAPGNGGGMHITGSSDSSITGGTVSNNSAANEGGGLWNGSGAMTVSDVFIFSNDANGDDSGASGGGGIYNEGGTLTTDATTVFNNNRATAGATGSGGGILVAGGNFTATGSSIINNDSNRAGGGIEVRDAATVNLMNVILNSNVTGITTGVGAPGNGGGLHVTGTADITITGGTVNLNDATNEGGGLWNGTGVMTLDGTTITYNTASGDNPINGGGGVFNNGGTLNAIAGTDISHNNVDGTSGSGGGIFSTNGTVTLTDATIEENVANRAGGGIELIDGNLLLNDTSLSLNNAGIAPAVANPGNGGGLHISGTANATITNSSVDGNLAASEGGGLWNGSGTLTVDGALITNNIASGNDPTNGGGGIFNNGGTLDVLTGTMITTNIADGTSGSGGGIFSTDGTVTLTEVTIDNNQANRAGGGIEIIDGSLTLDNITLTLNNAGIAPAVAAPGNGGGLHISGNAITNITDGTVDGNLAAAEGGGLWNGAGTMTIDGTTINANIASGNDPDQGGGGIYNLSGLLDISNNTVISNNIADGTSGSGGGILNDLGATLSVFDSEISGNTSNRAGGGIEDNSGSTTIIKLNNTNLDNNETMNAPGNGGGLHVTGNGGVNITNGTVNSNIAGSEGGGLWNGAGTMTVDGTTIDGNTASGAASDQGGGGIYNLSGVLSITNGTNITNNIANGASGSGGGILNDMGGTLTISNSQVIGNTSNRAGGGIEDNSASGTMVTVTNVRLNNNHTLSAPGNGGGLHVTGDGNVSITDGIVSGNTAGAEGGGLWNGSGTMTVDKTVIRFNTASGPDADNGGGGLFNEGGNLSIINAIISNNTADGASGSGGGILNNTGTLTVSDTQLDGNMAMRAGGGIEENSVAGSLLTLIRVNLTNNNASAAPGNGGALHITGPGDSSIFSGTVSGNTAASEGGAFWNGLGIMTIDGVMIDGNSAAGNDPDNGGGGIFNNGGSLNIIGRTNIRNNMATGASGSGGGIFTVAGDVVYTEGIMDSNSANRAGGAIEMIDGTLDVNKVQIVNNDVNGTAGTAAPGNGGAIHVTGNTGLVTITESNLANNEAALEGGALWNQRGTFMSIETSTIDNNRAFGSGVNDGGAGIFNNGGMVDINTSTISNNEASAGSGSGGAVHNAQDGLVMLMRSTISGNSVAGSGGGIFNNGNNVDVNATTIVFNEAGTTGGGIESVGNTFLKNTIVALNSASSGIDVSGSFTSNDYNLIGTDDLSIYPEEANDIEEADPVVGPLQDNGGLTQTHELLIGSAAFNAGDPADLFNDQIEQPVFEGIRDIGAYEAQENLLSIDEVANSGYAIVVYPNPSKGLATIEIPAAFGADVQITIVELSGKIVKNYKIRSGATELDFNGMANGVYIIKVVSENASSTHRLILAQ